MWSLAGQEEPPFIAGGSLDQVSGYRLTHFGGQRHPPFLTPFATHDDFACSPTDVTELETGHFDRSQPEAGDQGQHCQVPDPDQAVAVAMVQQGLNVASGHHRRHRRQPPSTDRWHRRAQPKRGDLKDEQIPQQ